MSESYHNDVVIRPFVLLALGADLCGTMSIYLKC